MSIYKVSPLGKTWVFDIDGTVVKHNGYKIDGYDTLLDGAKEFFAKLPDNDLIIFVTSRTNEHKELTERFLRNNQIRFDAIIYNAPYGERVLVNDKKPSGLQTAIAINTVRNEFVNDIFEIDETL